MFRTGFFSVLFGSMGALMGYLFLKSMAGILSFAAVLFLLGAFLERIKPSEKSRLMGKGKKK